MSESQAVILVFSTSHAIRIERLLAARGISCRLVPVPRHLSSDCGVCVRLRAADVEQAQALVQQSGLEVQGVFEL